MKIELTQGPLDPHLQSQLTEGLEAHSRDNESPTYEKKRLNWLVYGDDEKLIGALTADVLWDWMYISELWVDQSCRGTGLGKKLMAAAEAHANEQQLTGLWLWTQSWQAPKFYQSLGFIEFTRFEGFPAGHSRIGLRKQLKGE